MGGVEVDGEHPVGAGGGEEVGDEAGGDGDAGLVFFVGASVAVIGDDGGDAAGGGAFAGVDHYEEFHEVVVDRGAGGLDDEDVALADVFEDADEGVVVGEFEDVGGAHGDAQVIANRLGQLRVGVPGEHYQLVVNTDHLRPPAAGGCWDAGRRRGEFQRWGIIA